MLHVLLVTDDSELSDAVRAARPPAAHLQIFSHQEFRDAPGTQARQCWFDIAGADPAWRPTSSVIVYFGRARQQPSTDWPTGKYVPWPAPRSSLPILWSTALAQTRDSVAIAESLPAWLLHLHGLKHEVLCRALVKDAAASLGYRGATLYLATTDGGTLEAVTCSDDDVIRSATQIARDVPKLQEHFNVLATRVRKGQWHEAIQNWAISFDLEDGWIPLVTQNGSLGLLRLQSPTSQQPLHGAGALAGVARFLGTEMQQARYLHEEARHARIDCLTKLANVRSFQETLHAEVRRAVRYETPLSLIAIDLDGLKEINDTRGHLVGDEALRHAAACIASQLRGFDIAARIGGDEFAVLLPATDYPGAQHVATRIESDLRESPLRLDNIELRVSLSTGIAAFERTWSTTAFRDAADRALYNSKRARNTLRPAAISTTPTKPVVYEDSSRNESATPQNADTATLLERRWI